MSMRTLASVVAKAAPLLATVIGGPFGGVAAGMVSSVFGGDSDSPDELVQKIESDPSAMIRLKEIEAQHSETLLKLANDREYLNNQEMDSTRNMSSSNGFRYMLFGFLSILTLGAGAGLLFVQDEEVKRVILVALGIFMCEIKQVFRLYFGTSKET